MFSVVSINDRNCFADPVIKRELQQLFPTILIIYRQGGERTLREFYDTQNVIIC